MVKRGGFLLGKPPSFSGFTLIELMIVVAIIGILAAIAIPQFANTIRKSKEGAVKGSLASVRSALSIYYSDMEGQYPQDLSALLVSSKYLNAIPSVRPPDYHEPAALVTAASAANDAGGWLYDNVSQDTNMGAVWINCTHTDTKGSVWTNY